MRGRLVGLVVVAALTLAGCGAGWAGPHVAGDPHSDKPKPCYWIEHEDHRGYTTSVYGKYCRVK